jgi:uncharacterized protein (TIGR02231 family)
MNKEGGRVHCAPERKADMRGANVGITILFALSAGLASAQAQTTPVETSITDVTVFADRALITRTGPVKLEHGTARYSVAALPVWLDSGSLRARLEPAESGEIVDVELAKEFLVESSNEELRAAEKAVEEVNDRLAEMDDELALLESRSTHVEGLRGFSMDKLPRDAVSRDIPIGHYRDLVEFVDEELTAIKARQREITRARRALLPEKQARERRLGELQTQASLEQYTIVVTVSSRSLENARLAISYMLPGATWEPQHEFRFASGDGEILFSTFASITQTTGEDWTGATLKLSTQSSIGIVSIPELETLLVGRDNADRIFRPQTEDSFSTANTLWLNKSELWNTTRQTQQTEDYRQNRRAQTDAQSRAARKFERLQKRGTTALYEAMTTHTIRSDGRPVRVLLTSTRMSGTPRLIAAPEVSLNATRTAHLENTADQPILPGTVALFANGAFVGNTEVDFVAAGEDFDLFAGLADEIKITRDLDRSRSRINRGRRTTEIRVAYVVEVENLVDRPARLDLADRIPVSHTKEIKVTDVEISPPVQPDADGLLLWKLDLVAKSTTRITISYAVEYPTDLATTEDQAEERLKMHLRELEAQF